MFELEIEIFSSSCLSVQQHSRLFSSLIAFVHLLFFPLSFDPFFFFIHNLSAFFNRPLLHLATHTHMDRHEQTEREREGEICCSMIITSNTFLFFALSFLLMPLSMIHIHRRLHTVLCVCVCVCNHYADSGQLFC